MSCMNYQEVFDLAFDRAVKTYIQLYHQYAPRSITMGGSYLNGITFNARTRLAKELKIFAERHPSVARYSAGDRYGPAFLSLIPHWDRRVEQAIPGFKIIVNVPEFDNKVLMAFVDYVKQSGVPYSETMDAGTLRTFDD